jgi:LmbE family N-acetylglucosaminyl deacetylase
MSHQRSRRALVWLCLGLCCLVGCRPATPGADSPWPEVVLTPQDRVLVLAPHPDDESLACGGIIQQAVAMGIPVHVAFLTYGDNNQWSFAVYRKRPELGSKAVESMGLMRHDEAIAATGVLGLRAEQLTFLGYPDFGTLDIWHAHWGDQPAFRSMLTRVTEVPYANAFRPGAPYKGEEIVADLTTVLRDFKPTKVFLSHPADHNPDHQSLYLFTHVALWDLASELEPEIYPYLVHYPDWPTPPGYHANDVVEPPPELVQQASWQTLLLDRQTVARKLTALQQHQSQYKVSRKLLSAFVRTDELFGDLPVVPLTAGAPDISLAAGEAGSPTHTLGATWPSHSTFPGRWHTRFSLRCTSLVTDPIGLSPRCPSCMCGWARVATFCSTRIVSCLQMHGRSIAHPSRSPSAYPWRSWAIPSAS